MSSMRRFGLIGYPLGHSFSKKFFTRKFEEESIQDCLYELFPIPAIDELPALLKQYPDLNGFNVTIPYKEQVIPYLNEASDVVKKIGACNCVKITGGKLKGFNTDVVGFEQSLLKSFPGLTGGALILGTGGAAKAVEFVVGRLGLKYKYVSREGGAHKLSYQQLDAAVMSEHRLIINTTPLGMSPAINQCPPIPYEYLTPDHCLFDLVYNPEMTLFMKKGMEQGARVQNGLEMLVIQAEESWKIWNAESN
jgi:shikimate dehydrogenase